MSEGTYFVDALRAAEAMPLRKRLSHRWDRVALDAMVELNMLIEGRLVEEGDCLIWTGAVSDSGNPRVWVDGSSDVLRRTLWTAMNGEPEPDDRIGVRCRVARCVEPSHLIKQQRTDELKGVKRTEAFKAKVATAVRAAKATLTQEQVDMIRASPLNNVELARQMNRRHQTIARVRTHDIWKSYVNPFAGLGAR